MPNGNHKRCLVALPTDELIAPMGDVLKHIYSVHEFLNTYKKAATTHMFFDKKQEQTIETAKRYFRIFPTQDQTHIVIRESGCVLIYDVVPNDPYIQEMLEYCKANALHYIVVTKEDLYKAIRFEKAKPRKGIRLCLEDHKIPTDRKNPDSIDKHLR